MYPAFERVSSLLQYSLFSLWFNLIEMLCLFLYRMWASPSWSIFAYEMLFDCTAHLKGYIRITTHIVSKNQISKESLARITENIAEAWPHQSIRTILDASPISPNNKMPINVKYGSDICIRSIWFSIKSAHICILFRQMSRWSWIRIAKHQSQILSFYFYYFWYLIQCISCSFVSISIILCCFAIHPTCVWVWWVHTMPASCIDKTDGNSRIVAVVIIAGFLYIFDFTYSIWIARYRF